MARGPNLENKARTEWESRLQRILDDVPAVAKYAEKALDKAISKGSTIVSAHTIADVWHKGTFGFGSWDNRHSRILSVFDKANKEVKDLLEPKYISAGWKGLYVDSDSVKVYLR
ncbi:MAG: hypothetical protein C0399_08185 [Syntrophus sp. (in: bacteria)]|nr:hypothetical protein [Syntrophus sp. (in: bacteria)]